MITAREGAALLSQHPEVQQGMTDDISDSPISAAGLRSLRSDDRLVARASLRTMQTRGYIIGLRAVEAELVRLLGLLEGRQP